MTLDEAGGICQPWLLLLEIAALQGTQGPGERGLRSRESWFLWMVGLDGEAVLLPDFTLQKGPCTGDSAAK